MSDCVLCKSKDLQPLRDCANYFLCNNCDLRFLSTDKRLSFAEEKHRYEQHNNDVNDQRYRKFMEPLFLEVTKRFPLDSIQMGLDYGAGKGPMLAKMLSELGHAVALYDPMFFESTDLLNKKYDFIFASESAEHFYDPLLEFERMFTALKDNGFIAVMTSLVTENIDFPNWYYRKDPSHVVFYSERTFDWLKTYFGFKNCEVTPPRIVILSR